MSRARTQRGKARPPTQSDKRKKPALDPTDPFDKPVRADTIDRAIDALDITLQPVPRRPDAKGRAVDEVAVARVAEPRPPRRPSARSAAADVVAAIEHARDHALDPEGDGGVALKVPARAGAGPARGRSELGAALDAIEELDDDSVRPLTVDDPIAAIDLDEPGELGEPGDLGEPGEPEALDGEPPGTADSDGVDVELDDGEAEPVRSEPVRFGGDYPRARTPLPGKSRAITIGETAADDLIVEVEELPQVRELAVAVHDDAARVSAAQDVIAGAGHVVAISDSGVDGIDRVRAAMARGVDALVVALPGGEALIDAAYELAPRRPIVIAACEEPAGDALQRAISAGADLVTVVPYEPERLAPVLLAAGRLLDERVGATAARDNEEALRARLDAVVDPEPGAFVPFELFQRALELELKRARRYAYPIAVALFAVDLEPEAPPGVGGILRARSGNALIHTIRDIDVATELEDERYFVLLPYTTVEGAVEVARRILRAVRAGDPVVMAGRSFPPRVVGAVAGAEPGQPMAFSRLLRDATRALEQARREGADLAVHP